MARKYLRSLLFSMECISTLFYGDILSMNTLELVAEIAISLWSIYTYGALVGAQGELLNARARREAAFEQSLGELQHYLVQNEVPKKLKRQIKSYYARVWRRRKGEKEFAAVAHVSHTLLEDVVLATLRGYAARVTAFHSLDEHFLRGLLVCLHYVVCSEGEEVAMKGDVDRSMYFIAQGRVLVKLDSGESIQKRGNFWRVGTCSMCRQSIELPHKEFDLLTQIDVNHNGRLVSKPYIAAITHNNSTETIIADTLEYPPALGKDNHSCLRFPPLTAKALCAHSINPKK